jgi:Tfp pilus assembly protein PilF
MHRGERLGQMKRNNLKHYLALSVSLITFAVYLSALRNEFVEWDDNRSIVDNPHIRSLNADFFRWAFLDFYSGNWHPLTWISHAMDYAVWGLNPLGHHLTSIILHAVNSFLVVFLITRLLGVLKERITEPGPREFLTDRTMLITAGITGLLFGLHPLHVESVAWVAERKDLLCALFFLLSIVGYTAYVRGQGPGVRGQKREDSGNAKAGPKTAFINKHYIITLGFFILALLSKPMAVTLPVVLLILDWYPFNRIRSLKTFRPVFIEKLPFIACSLISSVLTILAQRAGGTLSSIDVVPLSARVLVGAGALIDYLWKMIWPLNLIPLYPYPKNILLFSVDYFPAIVLVIVITAACMVLVNKQKVWLTAWGYYVATLVPILGIVQVGSQSMADRYTYLPSLGPFLLIGLAAAWISGKANSLKRWSPLIKVFSAAVGISVFIALSYLTIAQTGIWKNSYNLWSYVIENEPTPVPQAYFSLGIVFGESGQLDAAISSYNKAIALNPAYYEAYENRGYIFEKMEQLDKAIDDYNQVIAMKPSRYRAYYNRGAVFGKMGQFDRALADYDKVLALNPSYYEAYNNRGAVLINMGRLEEALADYDQAMALDPSRYEAYYNRGNVHLKMGQQELARADYRKACALGYNDACKALSLWSE